MPVISTTTVLAYIVFPAVLFALLYGRLSAGVMQGLTSPYPKADVRKRLYAGVLDGLLVVSCAMLFQRLASWPFLVLGAIYVLLRDGVRGQSVGKFFFGLVVMHLESGKPATLLTSAKRNILLLVPGVNVAALLLEVRAIWRDPQGQRLGDRLAQTQVVEGLGARDIAAEFVEWLMSVLGEGAWGGRRRRRTIALGRADDWDDPKAA
jgi:uncharacterized RDD family membrane protein YckC